MIQKTQGALMKVLFFSGSLRQDSMNCKDARHASEVASKIDGVDAEFIALKDFDIPLYDGDIEEKDGMPEGVKRLKELFESADGLYIASPEYNGSFSGALKNAIDWVSRPASADEAPLSAFVGKFAAISSATAGAFGGINGMNALRLVLSVIKVNVIANQLAIPKAFNFFDKSGELNDDKIKAQIASQVEEFCDLLKKSVG